MPNLSSSLAADAAIVESGTSPKTIATVIITDNTLFDTDDFLITLPPQITLF